MNIGVIGLGSFGQQHVRVYAEHPDVNFLGVWDISSARVHEVGTRHDCEKFENLPDLLCKVDAVSIVTPAVNHAEIAMKSFDRGVHVLVEKPIATNLDDAQKCIEYAEKNKCIFQVGHLERFNAASVAAEKVISSPYFMDATRLTPYPNRNIDVDVVLDIMIHDLDIILRYAKSEIKDLKASGAFVRSSCLDVATARIVFENGCVANVSASRVSDTKLRSMVVAQPETSLYINYVTGRLHVYPVGQYQKSSGNVEPYDLIGHEDEPLFRELDAFIQSIKQNTLPLVSGRDGLDALNLAQRIADKIYSSLPNNSIASSPFYACDVRNTPSDKAISVTQG